MITIGYITSRIDPCLKWFVDSLDFQTSPEDKKNLEIIFVDRLIDTLAEPERRKDFADIVADRFCFKHIAPKPCSWQGTHRLTKDDWFSASNARNTVIIHSTGDHIVFVDDLSVLTGAWFRAVKESSVSGKITCGAYRKVKELHVDNGNIINFVNHPTGIDNRFPYGNDNGPIPASGHWLYGCSFSAPVQALIDVNGSDEACDGMGFEDCILGIRLENCGYKFQYDRRMLSYESEEHHHLDKVMRREDKGISPNDKSHAILSMARGTNRAANLHFGPDGIAGLRKYVQEHGVMPELELPTNDWYDNQPISEFI